ncbi:MAG: FmdB family zinc ribbon protein [Bdellovibrionota bacterium]
MPIYEYECPNCGKFEVLQKVNEEKLKECPKCKEQGKSVQVEKLISHSSFVLKGTGWYETDYAHKGDCSSKSCSDNCHKE